MQDFSALEGKTLAELREIGKVLGIADTTLRKKELLEKIAQVAMAAEGDEPNAGQSSEEQTVTSSSNDATDGAPKKRGRRPRMNSLRIEENKPAGEVTRVVADNSTSQNIATEEEPATEQSGEPSEAQADNAVAPKRRGRKPKAIKEQEEREAAESVASVIDTATEEKTPAKEELHAAAQPSQSAYLGSTGS